MMEIYTISDDAQAEWHWVKPYIERAIGRNVDGYDAERILRSVLRHEAVFLVIKKNDKVVMVSTIEILPEALNVHTMTGDNMKDWLHPFDDALAAMAKAFGKQNITSLSRRGMAKIMQTGKWKPHSVMMWRQL